MLPELSENEARARIARRIAAELEDGALVNLGIGIPQLVPDYVPKNVRLILQTENGVINAGPGRDKDDLRVIDAGGTPVSVLPGGALINKKSEDEIAQKIFNRLRVKAPSIRTQIINLSGGNQQKVVLGKWLLDTPKILIMDEPTKGIDVGAKAEIYTIMGELAQQGMAIVLISSDMSELCAMSDRCLVLSNGKITGEFVGEDITQENVMRAAIAS